MNTGARFPSTLSTRESPQGTTNTPQEDAMLQEQRNVLMWEEEWRAMDAYRRGYLTQYELQSFLKSCFFTFPPQDLERFFELYSDPSVPEDPVSLTKAEFLKFRRVYTARDSLVEVDEPSDDEEEEEEEQLAIDPDSIQAVHASSGDHQNYADQLLKMRHTGDDISSILDGDEEDAGIVIDTEVLEDELFAEEDEDGDEDSEVDEAAEDDVDGGEAEGEDAGGDDNAEDDGDDETATANLDDQDGGCEEEDEPQAEDSATNDE